MGRTVLHVCTLGHVAVRLLSLLSPIVTQRHTTVGETAGRKHSEAKRTPSILIVDDETNVALTLQMVFEEFGYQVTTAESCLAALRAIRVAPRYDAVITDLCMEEDRSGLRVASAAAQLRHPPGGCLNNRIWNTRKCKIGGGYSGRSFRSETA